MNQPQHTREEFKCAYQGYRGRIIVGISCLTFSSEQLTVEFPWECIKQIKVTTKHLKDVPTTMLEVKVSCPKQPHHQQLFHSGKHYFYYFDDIVVAEKLIQRTKSASEANAGSAVGGEAHMSTDTATSGAVQGGADANAQTNQPAAASRVSTANTCGDVYPAGSTCAQGDRQLGGGDGVVRSVTSTSPGDKFDVSQQAGKHCHGAAAGHEGLKDGEEEKRNNIFISHSNNNARLLFSKSRNAEKEQQLPASLPQQQNTQWPATPNRMPECVGYHMLRHILPNHFDVDGARRLSLCLFPIVGVCFLMLVAFLCSISVAPWQSPLSEGRVDKVFRDLEWLQQWRREQQQQQQRDLGVVQKTSKATTPVSLDELGDAAKEVVSRYVNTQHAITALRLRHLRRKGGEGLPPFSAVKDTALSSLVTVDEGTGDENDVEGSSAVLDENGELPAPKRFSFFRVKHDFNRCVTAVAKVLSVMRRALFGGAPPDGEPYDDARAYHWSSFLFGFSGGEPVGESKRKVARYKERLASGHHVVEYIDAEEAEERRTCLKLTGDLVDSAEILEGLFVQYLDAVMMPQYEAYLNVIQASVSTSFADPLETSAFSSRLTSNYWDGFDSEEREEQSSKLLRSIALRRHVFSLLEMEPLVDLRGRQPDEKRQDGFVHSQYSDSDGGAYWGSAENMTEKSIADILREFAAATRSGMLNSIKETSITVFRNIFKEMRYWATHKEEWEALVLLRLNGTSGKETQSKSAEESDDWVLNATSSLPLFLGQWCFLEVPVSLWSEERTKSDTGDDDMKNVETNAEMPAPYSTDSSLCTSGKHEDCDQSTVTCVPETVKESFVLEEMTCLRNENDEKVTNDTQLSPADGYYSDSPDEPEKDPMEEAMTSEEKNVENVELVSHGVRLRWSNALELLRSSHGSGRHGSGWMREGSSSATSWWEQEGTFNDENGEGEDDELSSGERNMVGIRRRVMQLFVRVVRQYDRYLSVEVGSFPCSIAALKKSMSTDFSWLCFLRSLASTVFWPPSWFNPGRLSYPLRTWLRQIKKKDPVVRHLYRDLLGVPLGEVEDVPWVLLNIMTSSHELLDVRHSLRTFLCFEFFALFIASFVLLFFLFHHFSHLSSR